MSAILKFDFQKRKQITISEVNYLKNKKQTKKKRPNFACDKYIFPKTRGNKNKQWTHSTPVNNRYRPFYSIYSNVYTYKPMLIKVMRELWECSRK